ncbi:MAG: hypothetical protein WBP45_00755 [Daejeonella sp.]
MKKTLSSISFLGILFLLACNNTSEKVKTVADSSKITTNNPISIELKRFFQKKDSTTKVIQIFESKDDSTILSAIYSREPDWWEKLSIVKSDGKRVLWEADFESLPVEQSIRSVKQIRLKGFSNLFFEVYGQTHQGNGFYYLYELKNKKMILKVSTRAVDQNRDGLFVIKGSTDCYSRIFKDDILKSTYKDINGDEVTDILLTGTIQILSDDREEKLIKMYPAQKSLVYNQLLKMYVEDTSKRKGFTIGDD